MYKEYINKIQDKEDKLLLSKTIDKYKQYLKNKKSISTLFLNEYQYKLVENFLKYYKIPYNYYIKNKYCDKKIIYFGTYDNFITAYKIKGTYKHQEILGTLFNNGYTFDKIGDIIIDDDFTYITNLTQYNHLLKDIKMINNNYIELNEIDNFDTKKDKFKIQNIIIPSLRIDVIISKLCNLSRSKTIDLIKNKKVLLNYKEITNNSYILEYEDILSIRGYGKYKIGEVINKTKKDNNIISIYKYN